MSEETTQPAEVNQLNVGLAHETFKLTLDKVVDGEGAVLKPCVCEFTYIWDFPTNTGLAHLISIDGVNVNITLHPTGIAGMLAFMSAMGPTSFDINGTEVVISRVILDLKENDRQAAIMFIKDGIVTQSTDNLDEGEMDQINAHVADYQANTQNSI